MGRVTLPVAPWLFIHDPTSNAAFASKLTDLIPNNCHVVVPKNGSTEWMKSELSTYKAADYQSKVIILSSDQPDGICDSRPTALAIRDRASENVCNFASVNLYYDHGKEKKTKWGTNHLDIKITGRIVDNNTPEVGKVAMQIREWLFAVLDTRETLFLISDEEMKYGDFKTRHEMNIMGYEYSTISEIRKKPKDLRIHVVGVILTKPTVSASNKLTFQVADKTGVLNVFLNWRGAYCDHAWNWCLAMQPGQRRALPLMPFIKVKENVFVTVAKLPFRVTGTVVVGTGHVVKTAGRGLCAIGRGLRMGRRTKWVLEEDFKKQQSGNATSPKDNVHSKTSTTNEHLEEKDENVWGDSDSDTSTTAGSDSDEKKEKYLI